ncbi:MAG: hypothetical protein JW901_03005 [Dehalococcoidia bacterium]|nr:hypothetical protein [Dehalococcoidia bacterium]
MLMINIDTFNQARARLDDPATRRKGIEVLRRMLDIKQAHLWRSDVIAPCCGNLGGFACQLSEETQLLEKALSLLDKDDLDGAKPMLDRLAQLIVYGMGQKETPDLIQRLTNSPGPAQ